MNVSEKGISLGRQLIKACASCHPDYQKILHLLDAGANPNVTEPHTDSALCALILNSLQWNGKEEYVSDDFRKILNLLLERGADVNISGDSAADNALCAAQYTMPEVTVFLLEHGADPNVIDNDSTVLDMVEFRESVDCSGSWMDKEEYWYRNSRIRKILLDHGAHRADTLHEMKKSARWKQVKRDIYHACWYLDADKLDQVLTENHIRLPHRSYPRLLRNAIDVSAEFVQKDYADDFSGYERRLIAVLSVLQKHGCDFNEHKGNALHLAVVDGYVETTRYLLAHGADPSKCDCGYTTDEKSEKRHRCTLAEKIRTWHGRWTKKTAQAFERIFPLKSRMR